MTDWQELVDFDEGVSEPFRPEPPPTWEPAAAKPLSLAAEHDPGCATDVDELIDLEQQAEFFLVLGEEESAIDLLMSHLRSSGGTSKPTTGGSGSQSTSKPTSSGVSTGSGKTTTVVLSNGKQKVSATVADTDETKFINMLQSSKGVS